MDPSETDSLKLKAQIINDIQKTTVAFLDV